METNGVVLNAPKAIAIHGDTLWVTDIDVLRAFNRRTGVPLATIDFKPLGAVQLNDVAVGPDGTLRVTDTGILMNEAGAPHIGPSQKGSAEARPVLISADPIDLAGLMGACHRYYSLCNPDSGCTFAGTPTFACRMETNKPLARAGYLLAAALIIIPLFDATTSVWPLHLGDERWRFGAVGTLSNVTLVPLLGLLLALAAATLADNRRTRRFIGWISAIFAAVVAALAVLFILDYFQVRTTVVPKFQHATSVASTTALVKHAVTIAILLLLSRAGFAGPKAVATKKHVRTTESSSSPLIPLGGTRAAPAE